MGEGSPKYVKHGFGVAILSFLCHIVGFSTDFWVYKKETVTVSGVTTSYTHNLGLWRYCVNSRRYGYICSTAAKSDSFNTEWYKATEAMEVLGMIVLLVILAGYILQRYRFKQYDLAIYISITCIVAAAFILIGVIIFAFKIDEALAEGSKYYHFSFALCIMAGLLIIISAILTVIDKAILYW